MGIRVGVVVLNWNGLEDTLECLASLRQVELPNGQLVILVVDNGSTDGSGARLRGEAGITLIELEQNHGYAAGNNVGICRALQLGCEYVLLLNNDTVVPPDFVTPLVATLEQHLEAGMAVSKVRYYDPPDVIWYAGGLFRQPRLIGEMVGLRELDVGQYDRPQAVDWAVGCSMMIHRRLVDAIGLLDERFFAYEEDIDYSYRAQRAGFTIRYEPASVIWHKVSQATTGDTEWRTYLQVQSRVLFFRKHIHGLKILPVIFLEAIRLLRFCGRALRVRQPGLIGGYGRGMAAGWRLGGQPERKHDLALCTEGA